MANQEKDDLEKLESAYQVFIRNKNKVRKTAKELGVARSTVRRWLDKYQELTGVNWREPVIKGSLKGIQEAYKENPPAGKVNYFILSSAQNNTEVHEGFFDNLEAYAEYLGAEILISQFAYNKAAYGKKSIKPGSKVEDSMADLWFDDRIQPYVCNDRIYLSPTLVFCAELNILPTAARPLSGFENYAGAGISGVFPHTTIALESIPSLSDADIKFNYTTGSVTKKNYIKMKAGLKAEHHHCFGALIVEVDHLGRWWARQLNAGKDGTFYDLDRKVQKGSVKTGVRVEAINWGDVHVEVLDPEVKEVNWGKGGIIDRLRPKYQFMHDVLDFYSRNHHRIKDPHAMFERWANNSESVEAELKKVVHFLNDFSYREDCKTVVVDSNHDNALERWLRESNYKVDPVNAIFYLEATLMKYKAISEKNTNFHLLESVLTKLGVDSRTTFLRDDQSFLICGDIETALHGDRGPNGARGSAVSFSKMGRKTNTGHSHSAQIVNGAYVAGTSTKKKLEFNKGPSSWSHSHIVTYSNSKRCIITIRDNQYCALDCTKKGE